MAVTLVRREWIPAGLIAGLTGAVTFAAFQIVAALLAGGPPAVAAWFAWVASVPAGDAIRDTPWAVPLGLLVHVAVAVFWAFGYLSAAERQPQLLRRPLISGVGFGVVVWFVMLAILVPAGKFVKPTIYSFDRDIVAHTLFFGVPLAFAAARLARAR